MAHYIVNRYHKMGKPITHSHLQKLLYYLQCEYFKKANVKLIDEDFTDGRYSPILKDVFDFYSWHYSVPIYESHDIKLSQEVQDILDPIIDKGRMFSAGKLSLIIKTLEK